MYIFEMYLVYSEIAIPVASNCPKTFGKQFFETLSRILSFIPPHFLVKCHLPPSCCSNLFNSELNSNGHCHSAGVPRMPRRQNHSRTEINRVVEGHREASRSIVWDWGGDLRWSQCKLPIAFEHRGRNQAFGSIIMEIYPLKSITQCHNSLQMKFNFLISASYIV